MLDLDHSRPHTFWQLLPDDSYQDARRLAILPCSERQRMDSFRTVRICTASLRWHCSEMFSRNMSLPSWTLSSDVHQLLPPSVCTLGSSRVCPFLVMSNAHESGTHLIQNVTCICLQRTPWHTVGSPDVKFSFYLHSTLLFTQHPSCSAGLVLCCHNMENQTLVDSQLL